MDNRDKPATRPDTRQLLRGSSNSKRAEGGGAGGGGGCWGMNQEKAECPGRPSPLRKRVAGRWPPEWGGGGGQYAEEENGSSYREGADFMGSVSL